jgi:hypothetical protein
VVAEHLEGEAFELILRQPVVVRYGAETIDAAISDPPEEGAVLEQLRVLPRSMGAQPGFQGERGGPLILGEVTGSSDQRSLGSRLPSLSPGSDAEDAQAIRQRALAE